MLSHRAERQVDVPGLNPGSFVATARCSFDAVAAYPGLTGLASGGGRRSGLLRGAGEFGSVPLSASRATTNTARRKPEELCTRRQMDLFQASQIPSALNTTYNIHCARGQMCQGTPSIPLPNCGFHQCRRNGRGRGPVLAQANKG